MSPGVTGEPNPAITLAVRELGMSFDGIVNVGCGSASEGREIYVSLRWADRPPAEDEDRLLLLRIGVLLRRLGAIVDPGDYQFLRSEMWMQARWKR